MPRLEFADLEEFGRWLTKQVNHYKKAYKVYMSENEAVAIPATSTRPHEYGYIKFSAGVQLEKLTKLTETLNIDTFRVLRVVWNPEQEPRVGETEEE